MSSSDFLFLSLFIDLEPNIASTIQIVSPVARGSIVPPSAGVAWYVPANALVVNSTAKTDSATIASAALAVNQKGGATGAPNQPVSNVAVTGSDGVIYTKKQTVSTASVESLRRDVDQPLRRSTSDYNQVFAGNGASSSSPHDASIEGTAYLTYTVINNSTYNVATCLDFCSSISTCGMSIIYDSRRKYSSSR